MKPVRGYTSRGVFLAGAIVVANLLLALQITGLTYGRFEWTALAQTYGTPTATPTVTPTLIPQGGSCASPTECASGFCVDAVCCDEACAAPDEQCNVPGRVGTCVRSASAPALNGQWLVLAALLLTALGVVGMRARRAD